jgi:hypothetical protein
MLKTRPKNRPINPFSHPPDVFATLSAINARIFSDAAARNMLQPASF